MMKKNCYIASITVWIGGTLLLVFVDFLIRHFSGDLNHIGMNETLWFLLQIMFGITSLAFLIKAVKHMPSHRALMLSSITIVLEFLVYAGVMWGYVVGTGVETI